MAEAGRPPFAATPAMRRSVTEMACVGMKHEAIARAIGCSPPTLRLHFADELGTGPAKKRAEIVAMLFKSAKTGNVSAQKKLEEMSRLAEAEASFKGDDTPPPTGARQGKKEIAAAAAQTAGEGTEWGDDLKVPTIQ